MSDEAAASRRPKHIADAERMLAGTGHDLGFAGARVALGRSGIAIGFPRDPMLHVSWFAVAAIAALCGVYALRRRPEACRR